MYDILKNRTYRALFSAQVIALIGTGLLTVALGLLAFDLAGFQAGAVLGTAYAIKMVAYVGLAPVASAIAERLPRKAILIGADLVRAAIALMLPFIDAIWQIYVLIFVLQAASATFTPAFQATIPDILTDEKDYTRALSLSRLAYEMENLISPMLAAVLLAVISYHWLFLGTVIGFVASALLVFGAAVPPRALASMQRTFGDRLTRGVRIYLATPRLRGLLALNLTAAAVGAFVLVNTVVMVRSGYGADNTSVAYALAAFGGGSMLAAFALPALLDRLRDRTVMITAAGLVCVLTFGHASLLSSYGLLPWTSFLWVWMASGVFYTAIMTPSGRLLRKSAHAEDRPALFAAQFALSHACWLITYPVAGWVGSEQGLPMAMLVLGALGVVGLIMAMIVWPKDDPLVVDHVHPELPGDHPHLRDHPAIGHRHAFVIDDEHRAWPTNG